MLRNANDIIHQLGQVIEWYFIPAINFLYDAFDHFFTVLEQRWYLMFIWLTLNTGFCIWIIVSSFFEWRDIFQDGAIRFALISHAKNKRLRESEERYQLRKAINREEAEARFQEHQAIIMSNRHNEFLERQKIYNSNRHLYSDDDVNFDVDKAEQKARYGPIDISKRDE